MNVLDSCEMKCLARYFDRADLTLLFNLFRLDGGYAMIFNKVPMFVGATEGSIREQITPPTSRGKHG
jgi:hypothetical protein